MRCKKCNGTGEITVPVEEHMGTVLYGTEQCDECGGTGEVLTNEEYLKSCNTEQLAEFLADKCNEVVDTVLSDASCDIDDIDNDDYWYRQADFVEWLKEIHNE